MAQTNLLPPDGIVTRSEAKERGLKRYFDGKPCARGHVSERFTSNWTCAACVRDDLAAWREAHLDKKRADGRAWYNDNIERAKQTSRSWYRANKAHCAAVYAIYYAKTAERREAKWKVTYLANREKFLARSRVYKEKNKERTKRHRQLHSEASRAACHKRRVMARASQDHYTAADIKRLKVIQKMKCAQPWCGVDLHKKYEVDHIIPIARGGSNGRRNVQLLCVKCNRSKAARHPIDVALGHGMLV